MREGLGLLSIMGSRTMSSFVVQDPKAALLELAREERQAVGMTWALPTIAGFPVLAVVAMLLVGAALLLLIAARPHAVAGGDERKQAAALAEQESFDDTVSVHRAWVHDAGLEGRELFEALAGSSGLWLNLDRFVEAVNLLHPQISPVHAAALVGNALRGSRLTEAEAQLREACEDLRSRLRDALEDRRGLASTFVPSARTPAGIVQAWDASLDSFLEEALPQASALGRRHHRLGELFPAYNSLMGRENESTRGSGFVSSFFDLTVDSAKSIPLEGRLEMKESQFGPTFAHAIRHFQGSALALSRSLRAATRSTIHAAVAGDEEYQSRLLDELRQQTGSVERLEQVLPELRRPWRLPDDDRPAT